MTESAGLGVGRALSQAREAQGLTIADVAQQLKFMPRQIEALEAERFTALPGPTIARGMVRSYARLLKLEPEPLLKAMEPQVRTPEAGPQIGVRRGDPVPAGDGGRRSTIAYLALSAIVLAVAAGAVYEWRHEKPVPAFVSATDSTPAPASPAPQEPKIEKVEKLEVAEAKPAPKPEPKAAPPKADPKPVAKEAAKPQAAKPQAAKPEAAQAAKPEAAQATEPKPAALAAVSPTAVVEAPKPAAGGGNRLVFRFEQDSWVEVIDADGRHLISSLNRAGTERTVRARPPLNLVVGNAQHVRVTYNDREIDLKPHTRVEVARFTIK